MPRVSGTSPCRQATYQASPHTSPTELYAAPILDARLQASAAHRPQNRQSVTEVNR